MKPYLLLSAILLATISALPAKAAQDAVATLIDDTFDTPVYVTGAPGAASSSTAVRGRTARHHQSAGQEVKENSPFLDARSLVSFGGERGLLSVAFDPDYDTNRLFYSCLHQQKRRRASR